MRWCTRSARCCSPSRVCNRQSSTRLRVLLHEVAAADRVSHQLVRAQVLWCCRCLKRRLSTRHRSRSSSPNARTKNNTYLDLDLNQCIKQAQSALENKRVHYYIVTQHFELSRKRKKWWASFACTRDTSLRRMMWVRNCRNGSHAAEHAATASACALRYAARTIRFWKSAASAPSNSAASGWVHGSL